ncbi:MAG: hypothetical protein ABJI96_09635 [Paracoccaceae bacterium]
MRPVLHGDVISAARALLAVPEAARVDFCAALIRRADIADKHRRQTGQVHQVWGNGSLMAAARAFPLLPEPGFDDDVYCNCVEMVLNALVKWRFSQKRN